MKIAYLLTTFPKTSETFLQREIRVMHEHVETLELYSLWQGSDEWEGKPIRRFRLRELFKLAIELPRWSWRKPKVLRETLEILFQKNPPNFKNVEETLLGLGVGLIFARHFEKNKPDGIHAAWATMPATAAWLIYRLTGIPFSTGAHAYDIYERGGDCLLQAKLRDAKFVHTSTAAAQKHLLQIGCPPKKIQLIRRGLNQLSPFETKRSNPTPIHLLSIGRLVEKKGFFQQFAIHAELKKKKIPFRARIIGDGPLESALLQKRKQLNLETEVELLGQIEFDEVGQHYTWADAFLFTGKIAANGDRDGLPNVIPEAMACGVPVLTTPISGTTEAIQDQETGWVLPFHDKKAWTNKIADIQSGSVDIKPVCAQARDWVENHFDANKNTQQLIACMKQSFLKSP